MPLHFLLSFHTAVSAFFSTFLCLLFSWLCFNIFFPLNSHFVLPISLPSHQCSSLPLLSILLLHTSSFSSLPMLLPVLSQCSLFSLVSSSFSFWGLLIPKDSPDLGCQPSLWLRSKAGSQREVFASWVCRQKHLTEMAVCTCHLGHNQT